MNICKSCVLMKITHKEQKIPFTVQSTDVHLMLLFCNYLTMFGNISIKHCFLRWFGNMAFKGKSVMFILDICHIVRCYQRLQTILCGSNEPEAQQVIQKVGRLNCGGELSLNRISGVDVTRVVFAPGSRLIA